MIIMNIDSNCILSTDHIHIWHNQSDEGPGLDFRSHIHGEYEILYVFSGDVEFYMEGYKYPLQSESMLLTPPNIFHGWKPRSRRLYRRVSVLFLPEMLDQAEQPLFLKLFREGIRFFPNTSSRNINLFIQALLDCENMESSLQKAAVKGRLVSLLSEISLLQSGRAMKDTAADKRILDVLTYLGEHLKDDLTLEAMAGRFNISKNYLNILFRQTTGTTVSHYIRIKRLALARQEMMRGAKAQEAAYNAGFNDYSNFYRAYKACYGCLPSAPYTVTRSK